MAESDLINVKKRKSLCCNFSDTLSFILSKAKGVSKVTKITVNKRNYDKLLKIIVFQIEKENYLTIDDASDVIAYHFDSGGFEINEWLSGNVKKYKMSEIDVDFDNDEVIVLKLVDLNNDIFEKYIDYHEKYIKEKLNVNEQINFYEDSLFGKEKCIINEKRMFNEVEVSDERMESKKEKIFPVDIKFNSENLMKNKELNAFQPFSTDWTNEMVDSIIGTMYEDKEIRKNNSFIQPVNYHINPPQYEHEFLEMQNLMVKNERLNSARPFVCHFRSCNRAFKRFEHLKRHYRIHTGERPFKCKFPGCHKSFARSDNLNQHLRVHNSGSQSINHGSCNTRYIDEDK
ncbi:hypothetical protein GVAV_000661 [Gurleya vavrai]